MTNQSFSILPISSFEKNGPFAWPGTLEECSDLLQVAHFYPSKDPLIRSVDFSPNVLQKLKGWSFLELSCSLFFFYFQNVINQSKQSETFVLNSEIWITASNYILNAKLSSGFTKFIKELGIGKLSKNDVIIPGLIYSLTYARFKKQSLCSKTSLENLLSFVDIGEKEKNKLIEKVFAQQNAKQLIKFLLDLKKNNRPEKNLTNFLQRLSLTIEDLGEVSQELIVLLEKRSLINLVELENFQIIDILSSSEGYVDKIVNLETSTYYHEILFDIIKNKESFSLDIFQLFENYFSTRFKNATTLEEKQDLLMTIEPTDLNKLITDFYQTEKNILTEKIQKNFSLLKGELSSLTPKEIIKSIVFTSALLLMIISKKNYVPPKNERFIGSPAYGSISYSYATRYAKQAMTDSLSSATPQSPTFATKSTKTTFHPKVVKMESAKVDQTLKSGKNKQTLSPTAKATKRAKLGSGTNRQKKAASITTATTSALTKSEQVKVIEQQVQALQGSSLISYIHNIEGTHLISPVGSTGCYGHTEQFNTIISYVLKSHPDWFLQPCDADHLIERRDSESLGMSRRNGATILLTPKVHQLKSKIDLNRDPDVTQVSQWILRTGEKTLDFLQNLDPEFAEANGINQELVAKQLEGCIKHDTQQFFKTQIDDKEGLPISDVNKSLKITTNSLENLSTKINNNCSSLDEKKVGQISFTAFENATQRAAFAHANTERLEKNPERVAHSFEQMENALNSLFNSIKRYCPDAVRNFDLQDSHHAVEMALKGKNKEALLDSNSARDSNVINQNFRGIAPRTAVVTNDAPLEWLGNTAENQPIISENQKIISSSNNQQFTPPFQPPL